MCVWDEVEVGAYRVDRVSQVGFGFGFPGTEYLVTVRIYHRPCSASSLLLLAEQLFC